MLLPYLFFRGQIFVALVYAADDFVNYTLMQLLCPAMTSTPKTLFATG